MFDVKGFPMWQTFLFHILYFVDQIFALHYFNVKEKDLFSSFSNTLIQMIQSSCGRYLLPIHYSILVCASENCVYGVS